MEERSIEGVMVGYSEQTKGYRVYVPKMRKIIVSRDVKFMSEAEEYTVINQNEMIAEEEEDTDADSSEILIPINESQQTDNNDENKCLERRVRGRPKIIRTGRPGRPKKSYRTTSCNEYKENQRADRDDATDNGDDEVFEDATANYAQIDLHEAVKGENKEEWYEAIVNEFKSLLKNDTWDVVEKPCNKNIIDCKIVLANKFNSRGEIYKRKARLVARGFNQKKGYDYDQTFAPVARIESFRMLIALAVQYNLIIHQMDVTSAFLNGKLDEEVYMEIPELLEDSLCYIIETEKGDIKNKALLMLRNIQNKNRNCCKLKKGLYGLKQASRQWNIWSGVYVDDMLIAGNNVNKIAEIKEGLKETFEIKDMGEANYCSGIEILRKGNEITLIQRKYIRDVLNRFEMENANGLDTPANINETFHSDTGNCETPYKELIGALMYLAVVSRPDIMNRVVFLAQFASAYNKAHWIAAKRILRYLKQTINLGLKYQRGNFEIIGYADADWGSNAIDRKSYTGYAFVMCNAAISWKSQKQ